MNNVEAAAIKQLKLGEGTEKMQAKKPKWSGITVFKSTLANLASNVVTAAINAFKKLGENYEKLR